MSIDFSKLKRQPTRKEAAAYRNWVKYLTQSKLSKVEVHRRAEAYVNAGNLTGWKEN